MTRASVLSNSHVYVEKEQNNGVGGRPNGRILEYITVMIFDFYTCSPRQKSIVVAFNSVLTM